MRLWGDVAETGDVAAMDNLVPRVPVVAMRPATEVVAMEDLAETVAMQGMQATDLTVAAAEKFKSRLAIKNSAC